MHLSDLHERGPHEREPWRRRHVLGDAWERNLDAILDEGQPDAVVFTGDAAQSGLPEEYEAATRFFTRTLRHLRLAAERFFVIPGNHDIARGVEAGAWEQVRQACGRLDPLTVSRWMRGEAAVPGLAAAMRGQVLERQGAYREWVQQAMGRPDLDPSLSPHRTLGYRKTLDLPALPFPVQVIGLDTAWLCGDDADANHLWLTEDQLMRLATDDSGIPLAGFRLGLMHHPFHELADGADCRRLTAGHVDLILRGHLHSTELELWADPDRQVRQLAAGCLYDGARSDHYPNGCQVVDLQLDGLGKLLRVEARFRSWSRRQGRWFDDNSLYEGTNSGRKSWSFKPPTASSVSKGNPFNPWTPVEPSRFLGRDSFFRWFDQALAEKRSLSLAGDRRVGKTSLLQAWGSHAQNQGRTTVFLSGDGPEGASPSAFTAVATGRQAPADPEQAADALAGWARHHEMPPVLLVDEADGLFARFDPRFFQRWRGMLGSVCFFIATRRDVDRIHLDLGRTSPFHDRLHVEWLGLLESRAADELLEQGQGILTAADLDLLRLWAGRHPFYLQLLGWILVDARQNGESLESALDRFQSEAASRLRDLWRSMSERDRAALRGAGSGAPARSRALHDLRLRGLVTESGLPFGEVLTDWLRDEAP